MHSSFTSQARGLMRQLPCGAPCRMAHVRRCAAPRSAATAVDAAPLPTEVWEMTAQAAAAIKGAAAEGAKRHAVTLINPVNEKAMRFTSTEAMDYPCSNMKEFETLVLVTKEIISGIVGSDSDIKVKRIDEGGLDGDLCAIVSSPGKKVVAVVWPTAEKLPILKQLAQDASIGQLLIVNPLWKTEGNLVSEFGILPWDRKANEEFVATFPPTYALYEQRIGAPSSVNLARGTRYETGAVVRVLRAWPGPRYVVHVMSADGTSQAVGGFEGRPTYKELEGLIAKAREAKLEIFELAKAASSLDLEAARGRASDDVDVEAIAAAFPSRAELEALASDPKAVRRLLVSLGLPGSGTPAKLQARSMAIVEALEAGSTFEQALTVARKLR